MVHQTFFWARDMLRLELGSIIEGYNHLYMGRFAFGEPIKWPVHGEAQIYKVGMIVIETAKWSEVMSVHLHFQDTNQYQQVYRSHSGGYATPGPWWEYILGPKVKALLRQHLQASVALASDQKRSDEDRATMAARMVEHRWSNQVAGG